jgi:hypothetical protein
VSRQEKNTFTFSGTPFKITEAKITGYSIAAILLLTLVSCSDTQTGHKSAVEQNENAICASSVDVWLSPALNGLAPFGTLGEGDKIKVINNLGKAALIEMKDGARGFINSRYIK